MIRAKTPILVLAGTSLLALSACTDPGYVTGSDPHTKAKQGALLGGLLGAGAGALAGGDAKGAVIGGALGAGAGAVIGNALDKQEQQLRQTIGDDRVKITNTGDRLVLTMPQDILFATDSFAVTPSLRDDLMAVAASLNDYPDTTVQVIGHTDSTGTAEYNQRLSERRAGAVANVLMDGGVRPGRVRSIGRGEEEPVASNLTAEGRAQNRRVEIVILPNR